MLIVIFAETMEHGRDEQAEEVLGDIILAGRHILSYLNDNDGLEEQGEEAGYGDRRVEEERHDYDGSSDRMPVQEGDREDGSGDPMPVQEGDRDDVFGDRTESDQVYIY